MKLKLNQPFKSSSRLISLNDINSAPAIKPTSALRNQSGMTLIEIMVVMGIVAFLLVTLGSTVNSQLQKSRRTSAEFLIAEVGKALDSYNRDCGVFPTTDQGLDALMKSPGESCSNWGPTAYIKKINKDPWKTPLVYESDGSTYTLKSLGSDKKPAGEGTAADISSETL
jgi:general secretion pathway protein G